MAVARTGEISSIHDRLERTIRLAFRTGKPSPLSIGTVEGRLFRGQSQPIHKLIGMTAFRAGTSDGMYGMLVCYSLPTKIDGPDQTTGLSKIREVDTRVAWGIGIALGDLIDRGDPHTKYWDNSLSPNPTDLLRGMHTIGRLPDTGEIETMHACLDQYE